MKDQVIHPFQASDSDETEPLTDDDTRQYDFRRTNPDMSRILTTFLDDDRGGNFVPNDELEDLEVSPKRRSTGRNALSYRRNLGRLGIRSSGVRSGQQIWDLGTTSDASPFISGDAGRATRNQTSPIAKKRAERNPYDIGSYVGRGQVANFTDLGLDSIRPSRLRKRSHTSKKIDNHESVDIGKSVVNRTIITTRYIHPVQFFHEPSEDGTTPCHWCDAYPLYGLFGIKERRIHVIDQANSNGYSEVENGFLSGRTLPSRMCIDCSLARVKIMCCEIHMLRVIKGSRSGGSPDPAPSDSPNTKAFCQRPIPWCCVCPGPATFQDTACGLLLCETCASAMMLTFDGNLTKLIVHGLQQCEKTFAVRADAEFLSSDGHLATQLRRV